MPLPTRNMTIMFSKRMSARCRQRLPAPAGNCLCHKPTASVIGARGNAPYASLHRMLYAVLFFCPFGIVETIQRAHQIPGNAADALERRRAKVVGKLHIFAVHGNIDALGFGAELLPGTLDISVNFFLGQYAALHIHFAFHKAFHLPFNPIIHRFSFLVTGNEKYFFLCRERLSNAERQAETMQQTQLTAQFDHNQTLICQAVQIQKNEDMKFRPFTMAGRKAAVVFIDGMVDLNRLQHFIFSPCMAVEAFPENTAIKDYLSGQVLQIASLDHTLSLSTLLMRICQGDAAVLCDGMPGALIGEVKGYARRSVSPPVNETVIMGPHEGFCETMRDNVVLIRKIMRTPALISEAVMIGDKTPSRVCLMYLNGVAPRETVEEIKRRLSLCRVDHVPSLGMLEQLLEDNPYSLLPQAVTTERPDRAVSFLSEGQVVILMENAPAALVMPAGLLHLYHAPDDTSMRWQYGTFLRLLRMAGMLIALFLPAIYVALTVYHPEGMSLSLLTSVLESQSKVPMTLFPSMLLMLLAFSLINEAGTRVPGAMGASLSIVGGIILGQAVVEADMFSPLLIVVVAISGLGTYAVPTYSLTLAIRIAQLLLVVLAGLAGYPGIVMGAFLLLVRICGLTSLGHPYFAPLSPARPANPDKVLRLPIWRQRLRGYVANAFRMQRAQGPMRAWDKEEK